MAKALKEVGARREWGDMIGALRPYGAAIETPAGGDATPKVSMKVYARHSIFRQMRRADSRKSQRLFSQD